jgi:hypothetical protein
MLAQEQAQPTVTAAHIQHAQRRFHKRQQVLPAGPGFAAGLVEVLGGGGLEVAVDGIEALNRGRVH